MRHRKSILILLATACTILLATCQGATKPPSTSYSEIVIDTFNPTGPANGVGVLIIDLFSASGVSSSQDPWTSPGAGALAVDGQQTGGNGSNPTVAMQGWAWIDYKPAQPLSSGDVLYVRIRGYDKTIPSGPYGIRILTAPSSSYSNIGSNPTDVPYEPDDTPTSGGVPTNPAQITLGTALTRCIQAAGDVDWVKITLP